MQELPPGAMRAIFNDPAYAAIMASPEDISQPTYDTANYDVLGQTNVFFFTVPIGGQATLIRNGAAGATVVKGLTDTNLTQAGILSIKAMLVTGILVYIQPQQSAVGQANTSRISDDLVLLYGGGQLEWKVGDKVRLNLPLKLFAQLAPIHVRTDRTSETTVAFGGGGGLYWPVDPAVVPANTPFGVTMTFAGPPVVSQDYDFFVALIGAQRRPIQ